jgi:hypothetical protein
MRIFCFRLMVLFGFCRLSARPSRITSSDSYARSGTVLLLPEHPTRRDHNAKNDPGDSDASLIEASTFQVAVAAERNRTQKLARLPAAADRFHNARNAVVWPETTPSIQYTEGHVISAPAGR